MGTAKECWVAWWRSALMSLLPHNSGNHGSVSYSCSMYRLHDFPLSLQDFRWVPPFTLCSSKSCYSGVTRYEWHVCVACDVPCDGWCPVLSYSLPSSHSFWERYWTSTTWHMTSTVEDERMKSSFYRRTFHCSDSAY